MKAFWKMCAILLGLLALTACGTNEEVPTVKTVQELIAEQGLDPGKETLVYAAVIHDNLLRDKVDQFNRTHEDVQIAVRSYTGATYQEGLQALERFITELAAGQVPDIIGGPVPYGILARKGYLVDLWPYIENDPDLGRENVLEAPLRASEVDGGLYTVFSSVSIHTLAGPASVVGERTSWTLDELRETFASMPEGSTILEYGATRSRAEILLELSLEKYVDWETGQCHFDCDDFRSTLEFLHSFPEDPPFDPEFYAGLTDEAYWAMIDAEQAEVDEWQMSGRQMLETAWITDIGAIQTLDLRNGGRCAFVGYPVEDGSVGSIFQHSFDVTAMSSTCKNKEAAWEFLRTVVMRETTDNSWIPIYRVYYDIDKRALMNKGRDAYVYYTQGATLSPPTRLPAMTEEQYQRFEDLFNSINKVRSDDSTLFDLIMEAAGPYFAGDKTLDETVGLIQRRASLYVSEQS